MKDLNIKDFLTHIFHGSIILFVAFISFYDFNTVKDFVSGQDKAFAVTVLTIGSYLIGLLLDPLVDLVDTFLIKQATFFNKALKIPFFPSYYLLKNGERCFIRLANNAGIRKLLSGEVEKNDRELKTDEKKKITRKDKEEVWENEKNIMLLFIYAKNRALKYGQPAQVEQINAYHRLCIFYRNMIGTTFISAVFLLFSNLPFCCCCCRCMLLLAAFSIMFFFCFVSYKYRTYYCRAVLNACS